MQHLIPDKREAQGGHSGSTGWKPALGEWSLVGQGRMVNGGGKKAPKRVARSWQGLQSKNTFCIEWKRPDLQVVVGNKDTIDAASLGPGKLS